MAEFESEILEHDIHGFKCGNDSIDRQIEESYFATLLKLSYAYEFRLKSENEETKGPIIGYYMVYLERIEVDEVNAIQKDEYQCSLQTPFYTAFHIGYIAVDERIHKKHFGRKMLECIVKDAINLSREIPIRVITLDALTQYHDWYLENGFNDVPGIESDGITIKMFYNCMTEEEINTLEEYASNYEEGAI